MSAFTATTTFIPNSFQLKLALNRRKSPPLFVQARFPQLDRRRPKFVSLVVRSSAANGNGVERRPAGNSSWVNSDNSANDLSGWANANSERQGDSKRNQSLVGILGAGAAGVFLVAGLTFAALSISSRSPSKVKQQKELQTTQQEKSLSSDNHQNEVEREKSETAHVITENDSEESKQGTNRDPSLAKANKEGNETIASDDSDMRQSSGDGDLTNDDSSQKSGQRESASSGSLFPVEASDKPLILDNTDGSFSMPTTQNESGNIATVNLKNAEAENLADSEVLNSSAVSENRIIDHQNAASTLNEMESPDPSYVDPLISENISAKSQPDAVIETSIIHEDFVGFRSLVSTTDGEASKELSTMDVDLFQIEGVSVNGDTRSVDGKSFDGIASAGESFAQAVAFQSEHEQRENDSSEVSVSRSLFDSTSPGNFFTSAGIPAPSAVSAALQAPSGKVLVPAVVDQLQSQALSALQVLKVIEDDVQPGDLCSRREYARWLVSASGVLSRNTTSKVYPAMYIENVSELAFDDIPPEDPDFPSIQGLAEAGLIASKLSRRDMQSSMDEDLSPLFFSPESPLSRQDLVSWKMALEKRQLPAVDRKTLQRLSGFIDIDKINPDAWPALVADLAAGEQGYTRLFQPEKPVTKAQAAIALSTGDASGMVSEELARIEAESMAEKAVTEHNALVAEVEKDLNASYEKELSREREKIDAVEKLAEEARKEVERLRAEREKENLSLMKERAAVDSEMEVLSKLRREMEDQLQTLASNKLEISYEKERLAKLRRTAETESQEIERLQYELEVERKALSMARQWAEDEAKKAREQAKALEMARDRWERQGIKVVVDNDMREEEDAGVTWLDASKQHSVKETIGRSENMVEKLKTMANEVRGKCKDTINKIIEVINSLISNLKKKAGEWKEAAGSRLGDSLHGVQQTSAEFTSAVKEGTKRVAGDWKEGVERFSQKFKT